MNEDDDKNGCLYAWMYPSTGTVEDDYLRCCIGEMHWDRWCCWCKNVDPEFFQDVIREDPRTSHELWLAGELR